MYKNILVPTDGSPLSRRTIRDAVKVARKLDAKVTGFYVAAPYHIEIFAEADYVPPDMINPQEHKTNTEKTAQRLLEAGRKAATANRVAYAGYSVTSDSPAEAIVKAARKYKCDLIYMGSHGRSGLSKVLLGSHTNKVLELSRMPVLIHR